MLSYIIPQTAGEEKAVPPRSLNLNHNFNLTTSGNTTVTETTITESMALSGGNPNQNKNGNNVEMICDETTKLLAIERTHIAKNSNILTPDQNSGNDIITTTKNQSENVEKSNAGDTSDDIYGESNVAGQHGKNGSISQIKKCKISKTTLKRVSFGSSKGSMVETLIFETPTPLPEHAERVFNYPTENVSTSAAATPYSQQHGQFRTSSGGSSTLKVVGGSSNNSCLDDSGIDLQEESERSKVRVTFFQSNKPQQVSPPDSYLFYSESCQSILPDLYIVDGKKSVLPSEMAVETTAQISYDRQISTESGWDNPFRPGGDLSREADEIVNLIKGGKPITPTGDVNQSITNGNVQIDLTLCSIENGKAVVDGAAKTEMVYLQSTPAQNGTKSLQSKTSGKVSNDAKSSSQTQVSNQIIPGPTSASHVVIQDKKKKKCNCCVIQ